MTLPGKPSRARCRVALALALALCAGVPAAVAAPVVVSSIRPLALIVEELAGDTLESRVLVSAGASPHDFVLRPSELALLGTARLAFWMGPALERPLAAPLERSGVPAVALLAAVDGAPGVDPHAWLDPRAAAELARVIAAELVGRGLLDPALAEQRLLAFQTAMRTRETLTRAALAPRAQVPFLSLHDGYRRFVARYGLRQVGALPGDHERQPGARSVLMLRRAARDSHATCLLQEPGDNAALAGSLVDDLGLATVVLDPLAQQGKSGPGAFDAFLATFAAAVLRCLDGQTDTSGVRP